MSRMLSFTVFLKKMSIYVGLLVLKIRNIHIIFASSTKLCMVSNRHHELGILG
jgi:hypothetical protein